MPGRRGRTRVVAPSSLAVERFLEHDPSWRGWGEIADAEVVAAFTNPSVPPKLCTQTIVEERNLWVETIDMLALGWMLAESGQVAISLSGHARRAPPGRISTVASAPSHTMASWPC